MKHTKILLAIFAFCVFAACTANKDATSNSGTKSVSETKPTNVATATPGPKTEAANPSGGDKIENPLEIKFDAAGFPAGWEWIDPEKGDESVRYDLKTGRLKMSVPSGRDYYGETRNAPMLLKSLTGDFEIETKVTFSPTSSYQGAGLIVIRNDSNYLRLERAFGGTGGGDSGIRLDLRSDEAYEPLATPDKSPTEAATVDLRLVRKGGEFTGFWRENGGEWREVAKTKTSYPATVRVGLIVCNTGDPIDAEFAYIKLGPVK